MLVLTMLPKKYTRAIFFEEIRLLAEIENLVESQILRLFFFLHKWKMLE